MEISDAVRKFARFDAEHLEVIHTLLSYYNDRHVVALIEGIRMARAVKDG